MTNFKVGDKVKILPRKMGQKDQYPHYVDEMTRYVGKTMTIARITERGNIALEGNEWYYLPDWLKLADTGTAAKVYHNILGFKVVVIPELRQIRLFKNNVELVKVELSADETMDFDPVYGFLMAYAKDNIRSNTKLQTELEKLRHDPVPEPKVKKVEEDVLVWVTAEGTKIKKSDLKQLTTAHIKNIVFKIVRQSLSPQSEFNIDNTIYILREAHRRNEATGLSEAQFKEYLLPF